MDPMQQTMPGLNNSPDQNAMMLQALMGHPALQQPQPQPANYMQQSPMAGGPMPVDPSTMPGSLGTQSADMYGPMFGAPPMAAAPTSPY